MKIERQSDKSITVTFTSEEFLRITMLSYSGEGGKKFPTRGRIWELIRDLYPELAHEAAKRVKNVDYHWSSNYQFPSPTNGGPYCYDMDTSTTKDILERTKRILQILTGD